MASIKQILRVMRPLHDWQDRCHEASLHLVRSGILPDGARVARGWHPAVRSQHSWVTVGSPYEPGVRLIDPTLWSHIGAAKAHVVTGLVGKMPHRPHGAGNIWLEHTRPPAPVGEIIEPADWDEHHLARSFVAAIAPAGLDIHGWHHLAHAPVGGWPAAEVFGAMYDDDRLRPLIPIDVVGMVTDRNPGGLYF